MPKKIYIAGKITGDPNYQLKFIRARQHLTKDGYTVLTPAVLPEGMTKADFRNLTLAEKAAFAKEQPERYNEFFKEG